MDVIQDRNRDPSRLIDRRLSALCNSRDNAVVRDSEGINTGDFDGDFMRELQLLTDCVFVHDYMIDQSSGHNKLVIGPSSRLAIYLCTEPGRKPMDFLFCRKKVLLVFLKGNENNPSETILSSSDIHCVFALPKDECMKRRNADFQVFSQGRGSGLKNLHRSLEAQTLHCLGRVVFLFEAASLSEKQGKELILAAKFLRSNHYQVRQGRPVNSPSFSTAFGEKPPMCQSYFPVGASDCL